MEKTAVRDVRRNKTTGFENNKQTKPATPVATFQRYIPDG